MSRIFEVYTRATESYNKAMIKPYRKDADYSYTLGFFPTLELISRRKELLRTVYVSSDAVESAGLAKIKSAVDPRLIIVSDAAMAKLGDKGNDHVAGVFAKSWRPLDPKAAHVVLVNPSDMGNLGNIMRSMLAFGFRDLAIVTPAADVYNPKTVRASMGAIFSLSIELFPTFNDYLARYKRPYIPFMLQASKGLKNIGTLEKPYALVFGNEASGLPADFLNDRAVRIEQSDQVDSLNLTTAVAIALYEAGR